MGALSWGASTEGPEGLLGDVPRSGHGCARSSLVLCPAAGSRGPAGGLAAAPPPGGCCARAQATPPHGRRLQEAWLCVSQAGPVRGDLCPGAAAGERLLCWELTGPPSRGCGCAGRRLCGTLWKAPGGRARSVWRERRRVWAALGDRPAVGVVPSRSHQAPRGRRSAGRGGRGRQHAGPPPPAAGTRASCSGGASLPWPRLFLAVCT